ncbi:RNMT-activating mini protein [Paragonimus westermani]|uniref:RNMT-activating mini protein n=1 Tax=Paragonimus westermani TaxID=34504 RepID=A0A5J4N8E4_9TREM|nr:RNMT-activating mini protein [Paragonimus westermani]
MSNRQLTPTELENAFCNRYTHEDYEYQAYCTQPIPSPPVIPNWKPREFRHASVSRDRTDRSRERLDDYGGPNHYSHGNLHNRH